ncbi:hypothetical protein P152DRAFT_450580 [Eremomyces bilateralis CBS 781.70]|uniref:Uncharacterized protein n=1 Tax=Eremomyces bilateralis CBS 781.70 TaxID=1392243 RepID=A0A6G1FZ52_9PEZI|nr:uncharacterized protein P152DRAFT_450580 [Eremomyces bilateralis CBS 781.70]KAF1810992.1 hypothetical protein P152DRAFT_450580 [Eremomyces bilateralis CBS 781.70]
MSEYKSPYEASASVLSTLSSSDILLLLSPAIPGPIPDMDPFEPLGRALSGFHPKVRHVPYVPSIGMRDIHREFLAEAGAVIVVLACSLTSKTDSEKQKQFAQQVTTELGSEVPSLLVVVQTPLVGSGDGEVGVGYDAVLSGSSCRPEHLQDIAYKAFGHEELSRYM